MRVTVNGSTGAVEIRPDATGARRAVIATIPRAYTSPETLRDIARQLADYAARVEAANIVELGAWAPREVAP